MLHHIPFEMQEEIMKWLPVKSLIQFRSVSKTWRSLIDSPWFIAAQSGHGGRYHRLLVRYRDLLDDKAYLSIVDDETFPEQQVFLTVPSSAEFLVDLTILSSCHGLFCLHGFDEDTEDLDVIVVVWNPSIRKSISITLPHPNDYVFGFGVCPVTNEIKILKANYVLNPIPDMFEVKVIILRLGSWRISSTISVGGIVPYMYRSHLVVGRFIYWLVYDSLGVNRGPLRYGFIRSFDISNDEFGMVCLPFNLAAVVVTQGFGPDLSIFKLKESLAVVKYDFNINLQGYTIWQMEHGVPNVFVKLFIVELTSPAIKYLLGLRECGENVLEMLDDEDETLEVAALIDIDNYNDTTMGYNVVGCVNSFHVYSYKETLLLLNQPDSNIFLDEDEDDYFRCLEL